MTPGDRERLREDLDRMKRARRSVRPEVLHDLLTRAEFERRQGKGDHWVYSHPDRRDNLSIDPRKPHLLPVYVSRAIRAIEEVI